MAKSYRQIINETLPQIKELFPWDIEELMDANEELMLVDIREPDEFEFARIKGSMLVPRGILEAACDYNYPETIPELVEARDKKIIVICRSGNRSVMAALTMQIMGYSDVSSLKSGVKGWNDAELPLYDNAGKQVDIDEAEVFLMPELRQEQLEPKLRKQ